MGIAMRGISSVIGALSNIKPMKKLGDKFVANPSKALADLSVASLIAKDGVGCAMYVYQSLNNEKIPEDKRKFVAALDLTNGGLMMLSQYLMFRGMQKYSGKIFDGIFKKSFNRANISNAVSRARMSANQLMETVYKKLKIEKDFEGFKKEAFGVFEFCMNLIAATIIAKRMVVPLLATPLASKVEKWMNKDAKPKDGKAQDKVVSPEEKKDNQKPVTTLDTGSTNLLDKYKKGA